MKTYLAKLRRAVLFLIPLLLAVIGFAVLDGHPFPDALFYGITMYMMGYGYTPPNILVEIARWTAPLATASGFILAIRTLRVWLHDRIRYLCGSSVAVYGPAEEKEVFLRQLDKHGIDGTDQFVPAQRYILTGSEQENFAFYQAHKAALQNRAVYLKCRSLPAQAAADTGLTLFCPEETAARLFWKQRELYAHSVQQGHRLRIVLLGFGKLGEEVLLTGLQNNIFAPEQNLEYHIFGDGAEFSAVHRGLEALEDSVVFHTESWYCQLELLEQADLVLVLEQEEQPALLEQLLLATTRQEIDVFASNTYLGGLLEGRARLHPFAWETVGCDLQLIFDDLLLERAKRINLRYAHLYSGVPETDASKEAEWRELDSFTRYSNISSADYHEVRLRMLRSWGQPEDGSGLTPEQLELLSELEHIRWCRYHYLNNWKPGTPENGTRKDKARRIHADLVPYEALSEAEKEKDRENIRILLSVR